MTVLANQSHVWIFLVFGAVAAAAIVWFYRRVPPTASRYRGLLLGLRVAAVALLVVALVEPIVALSRTVTERPVVAVLLDTSRSMSIRDGTGAVGRGDEAVELLNEVVLPRAARDAELAAFAFAGGVEPLLTERGMLAAPDAFEGGVTDAAQAFAFLAERMRVRNLGAVVVATDGAVNRGASPHAVAMSLGAPVTVLGVGSPDPGPDIAIEDAVTNRISYAGESVPIEVTVSSAGFEGADTVVELSEDGVTLDSRHIELSGTGEEVTVTFRVTPAEPGAHRYAVSVPPAAGELSTANNSRIVVTTAMKGKIRVLLAASRPNWDFAFVRRELESDRNAEVTPVVRVAGSPGSELEGSPPASREELYSYDLVVLVEQDWANPLVSAQWLDGFVRERGGGLLLLGIPGAGDEGAPASLPYVTIADIRAGKADVRARLTNEGETSPATRVTGDRFENVELWKSLPPVTTASVTNWSARADARALVEGARAGESTVPLVIAGRAGAGNVMAVLAEGLWRWKMAARGDEDVFDIFIANVSRWLTARGELERVVVGTDKDVFQAGEDVSFSAQVYGGDFRLVQGADVTVAVSTGAGAAPVATADLSPDGDRYRGQVGALPPGPYVVECTASVGGEEVGRSRGQFVVERFSLEDSETRRRSAVLREIAEESGGGYYTPETLSDLPEAFPMEWTQRVSRREIELWNSPWLLLGFVGLISAEWALRRKQGLP